MAKATQGSAGEPPAAQPAAQDATPPATPPAAQPAAPELPPLPDPITQPDAYTAEKLARGPQFEVYVKPKAKGSKDTDFVILARINGVAFWCGRGERRMVPMEVARIAFAAGMIDSGPPPTHDELTYVGEVLPELKDVE